MKLRTLFGFSVAWAGYLLMWWGFSAWHDWPVGIPDLAFPSRIATLPSKMQTMAQMSSGDVSSAQADARGIPVTPNLPSGQPNIGAGFSTSPILQGR